MTLGKFQLATLDLPDGAEVLLRTVYAPFDDEEVEFRGLVTEEGRVFLEVCVVDYLDREMRAPGYWSGGRSH